jgi:ribosomal protein L7Ae-like RNA K-turn-binding protein
MIPEEVKGKIADAKAKGKKMWAGANQTYRQIQNGKVSLVLIAENVEPKEITLPIIDEAKRKKLPIYYDTKENIAKISECPRYAAAACLMK